MAPVSAGTRKRGARGEQHPDDARDRGRQRRHDDERIGPRLEIHDDQQVDEHDRAEQSEQQSGEGAVHRLHQAEEGDAAAFRNVLGRVLQDFLNVARDRAEIATLCRRVDLHDRLDVVLGNRGVPGMVRLTLATPPST